MIRDALFSLLTKIATTRARRAVYALCLALTIGCAILLPRLTILTTRQGMVQKDIPVQQDFEAYMSDFGSPQQLVLVLEGDTPTIKKAAGDLAAALAEDPRWVRNVFHRVEVDVFRKAGLYYLTPGILQSLADYLADDPKRAATMLEGYDLPAILSILKENASGLNEDALGHPGLDVADSFLGTWEAALSGKDGEEAKLALDDALQAMATEFQGSAAHADPDGYLLSDDGRLAFLFIQQAKKTDETEFVVPFVDYVVATTERVLEDYPGVTFGFTGWPGMIYEDYKLLIHDLPMISLVAAILIVALFLGVFRSIHRTILVFVPLLSGIVWCLGITVLTLGHLNYLSSVTVGILFGLGIDFGIYFVRRFDDERRTGATSEESVERTFGTVGHGILTGGLTTLITFFAVGVTDQPAFSELGIVAGTGVACVLAATLLLLPALLVQFPPSMKTARGQESSPVMEASARAILRRPGTILAAVLLGLAFLAVKIPDLEFDIDLNKLIPADSQTVKTLNKMLDRSPYSDQYVVVIADDLKQVRELHTRLEEAETVRRVESLAPLIPENVDEKRALFSQIENALPPESRPRDPRPDLAALSGQLATFIEWLQDAEEDAFSTGRIAAMETVGSMLSRLEAIRKHLDEPNGLERETEFEKNLFAQRDGLVAELGPMLHADPITVDSLDPSIRDRFVGHSGGMALMAFPVESIWNAAFLQRFVIEVRRVAEDVLGPAYERRRVSGFAATYQVTAPLIQHGFKQATWAAAIVVVLLLLFDFKSAKLAILAATPLVLTVVFLLGWMAVRGENLTMATQIAFPILFGLAVDYGVHMVHRIHEPGCRGPEHAVGTTGKAIALAGATTLAGFGAVMLARHSALAAFGRMLFVGILVSVLTSLYMLPVILRVRDNLRRKPTRPKE